MTDTRIKDCLATIYAGYYWDNKNSVLYSAKVGNHLKAVKLKNPNRTNNHTASYALHVDDKILLIPLALFIGLDSDLFKDSQVQYAGTPSWDELTAQSLRVVDISVGDTIIGTEREGKEIRYGATYIVTSKSSDTVAILEPTAQSEDVRTMYEVSDERRVAMSKSDKSSTPLFTFLMGNKDAAIAARDSERYESRSYTGATIHDIYRVQAEPTMFHAVSGWPLD